MQALVEYLLHRNIFVNLLTVILVGVGGFIAFTMNREAFPNIDFDIVVVTTVYPGASPQEVEKLITIPIEESIKEVDGIKEYRSSSIENRSAITITIDPDVEDTQTVVDDVRSAVDRTEDLPEESEKPILVEVNTQRQPIIQWSLSRPVNSTEDYAVLRRHAEQLENEFLTMSEVARIEPRGWLDREIFVDVNPDLLQQYYLDTGTIRQALRERNVNLPGGDMKLGKREVIIRTVGEYEETGEMSRLYVRSNEVGENVQLRDVAVVREGFEEPEYLEGTHGTQSITLTVVKRQSADIIATSNKTKRMVMEFAPHTVVLHVPYPGRDAATVEREIQKPLRAFIEQNPGQPTGFLFFKRPALVSKVRAESSDGSARFVLTLNPDYVSDGQLDQRDEVFAEMFEELKTALADSRATLPKGAGEFSLEYRSDHEGTGIQDVNDMSYFVKRRLGILVNNGITGLILVIGSLFIFMDWRTSIMVAVGIPFTFGLTFIVMSYMNLTINLISMFSLVIVIGIVVDDAIIVSENIYRYVEEGLDYFEATARGTAEVFAPVLATISTTIAAFAPMMFMTGIFGKFMYTIPLVIILTLIASLIECFLILPSHVYDMNKLFPGGRAHKEEAGHWFTRMRDKLYRPSLRWSINHRWFFIVAMIALMGFSGALAARFGRFELFPSAIDALFLKVTLPSGGTLEETDRYLTAVGRTVKELPDTELDTFISRAGIQQKEGNDPFVKRGSNYGMLIVYLEPQMDRTQSADQIIKYLRDRTEWLLAPESLRVKKARDQAVILTALGEGRLEDAIRAAAIVYDIPPELADLRGGAVSLEYEKLAGGPPVGKDIAVEVTGDDLAGLERIAEEYKELVRKVEGVVDVDDDFLEGKDEIRLRIDEGRASRAGISVLQIATAVNTAFEGGVATSIKRPEEEVDIRVRFAEKYRNDRSSLNKIFVSNRLGNLIPVSSMARFEEGKGLTVINHLDGRRLITVTANVDGEKTTPAAANLAIARRGRTLTQKYPDYKIALGGQNEDTQESLASLGRAFLVGVLVIFMILASLFRSLIQPVVVLLAVPFSLIGVILAFLGHGEPLSFLAFMGIVGLSGVVVNDSIVLVDFANNIRESRPELSNRDVAVEAATMRLRAVLLTTITTVVGLIPTAYGIGGYDPFLVPMALSFAWGLTFSTVLTLGLVPIFYSQVLDVKDWFGKRRQVRQERRAARGGSAPFGESAGIDGQARDAEYGLGEAYQIHATPSDSVSRSRRTRGRGRDDSR